MKTGLYLNHNRNTAFVLQHKAGRVAYLTMINGSVELLSAGEEHFAHDWPNYVEGYPVLRALRKYQRTGLAVTDEAAEAMARVAARLGAADA